eukprot:TRINITY_DN2291_c0_g1_i1.p1 TRINITY_DN2291_c0_g1~~TRINITY_DN2291_c0_g1_i1.p1  ORF type:complete len:364 (+),score=58.30 TRINITY_DN2291_c0_g1_i1:144-1094(+)
MADEDAPTNFDERPASTKYKSDATRHRCDIAFCRKRRPGMRKVKRPKSEKQMERYCTIWTQIGGYPEGVNDAGKLVASKSQFYFCPEHIKPRQDGGAYRAYTVDDFLPRTLNEGGDPVWREITPLARAKFRGMKITEENVTQDQGIMEPQPMSLPLLQQTQGLLMHGGSNGMHEQHAEHPEQQNQPQPPQAEAQSVDHHPHMQLQGMPMTVSQMYGTPQQSSAPNMQMRIDSYNEQSGQLRQRLNLPDSVPDEIVERFHALSSECAEAMRQKARVEAYNRSLISELEHTTNELNQYKQMHGGGLPQGMSQAAAPSS